MIPHTIVLDKSDLLRPAMVVVDLYWVKCAYGLSLRFHQISDDMDTQSHVKCFAVENFLSTLDPKSRLIVMNLYETIIPVSFFRVL